VVGNHIHSRSNPHLTTILSIQIYHVRIELEIQVPLKKYLNGPSDLLPPCSTKTVACRRLGSEQSQSSSVDAITMLSWDNKNESRQTAANVFQVRPSPSIPQEPQHHKLTLIVSPSSVSPCEKLRQTASGMPGSIQRRRQRLPNEHCDQPSRSCSDKTSPMRQIRRSP
jgi:hypothetical protein